MAISASVDITKTPIELTVTSDKRNLSVEVKSNGETAVGTARFPVVFVDAGGRTWTVKSDNGTTAVYTG